MHTGINTGISSRARFPVCSPILFTAEMQEAVPDMVMSKPAYVE